MLQAVEAKRFPGPPGSTNLIAAPFGPDDALRAVGPVAMVGYHAIPALPPGALPVDADVRPHPHIGLSAVTYVLEGHVTHRDSLGNRVEVGPGGALLQVCGRGITHSERYERARLLGGSIALFQVLMAMPDGAEDGEPRFAHAGPGTLVTSQADGMLCRWIARPDGPATFELPGPTLLAHVTLQPGSEWELPQAQERGLLVWSGELTVGGATTAAGQRLLLPPGRHVARASAHTEVFAFGGSPVGPRWNWWNYLHSSIDRIKEARASWRAGVDPRPVGDTESFTPAPPDEGRPLRRLNAP